MYLTAHLDHVPSATEEDMAWATLESELAPLIEEDLARASKSYAGLRGTTILGTTRLAGDLLQLRTQTDTMTVDHELAMVMRKALTAYLADLPPDSDLIELTPVRSFLEIAPDGVWLRVRIGRFTRSRLYPLDQVDLTFTSESARNQAIAELVEELGHLGPDHCVTGPVKSAVSQ